MHFILNLGNKKSDLLTGNRSTKKTFNKTTDDNNDFVLQVTQ